MSGQPAGQCTCFHIRVDGRINRRLSVASGKPPVVGASSPAHDPLAREEVGRLVSLNWPPIQKTRPPPKREEQTVGDACHFNRPERIGRPVSLNSND